MASKMYTPPKSLWKKPAQKAKEYIPYCNHIRFADRGWEETVDTLEIVGAILHFFKSSKTFRANEVQKINFFLVDVVQSTN